MSVTDSITSNLGPSFAAELRGRTDAELIELFELRPDLISPIPADMTALASRATSAPSLIRAIETLNLWQLQVLEACAVIEDSFTGEEIVELTAAAAVAAISELHSLGLIYRDGKGYRTPRAVREILGESIAGLGPSLFGPVDFKGLKKAPPAARDLLAKLTWGPPRGQVEDIAKRGTPIEWLLTNHYLIPIDTKTVALPREVAIHLRGGKIHREQHTNEPELETKDVKSAAVDQAAIAAITNILRLISELANYWAEETPTVIQSGGLGLRDLRKTSEHLGIEEQFTGFIAELAYQSGIITIEGDGRILPTVNFDLFQSKDLEEQWVELVTTWRLSSRVAGLIGRSESRNATALGSELDRSSAVRLRELTLSALLSAKDGAPALNSLVTRVAWNYPHRRTVAMTDEIVRWTAREAEWLGLTGAGAISTFGTRFLIGAKKLGLQTALPKPVDHILIQGDNTAIAPGPLMVDLARQLSTFADIESRGSATVYRFTEKSIRRGIDHGHTGEEISNFLAQVSKTPVPQPLQYLVSDVARKHGQLRVGTATSYLRSADESALKAILSDRALEHLRLRLLAPQVLIADAEAADLIADLRDAGHYPVGENISGAVIKETATLRAKSRPRPPRILSEPVRPSSEIMQMALRALRTGERSTKRPGGGELPRSSAAETLALLNEYLGKGVALRIGYADTNGAVSLRTIDPLSLSMGTLIARDHLTNGITPLKLARITGVTRA